MTESRIRDPRIDRHGDVQQLLREHGLQVTAQRLAILRAVASRPHATADERIDDVRAVIGSISRQAVDDTLSVLVEKNLLRRIQPVWAPEEDIYWGAETSSPTPSPGRGSS